MSTFFVQLACQRLSGKPACRIQSVESDELIDNVQIFPQIIGFRSQPGFTSRAEMSHSEITKQTIRRKGQCGQREPQKKRVTIHELHRAIGEGCTTASAQ